MTSRCEGIPERGTLVTRTGAKVTAGAQPADYPLIGWCRPCGMPVTAAGDGAEWLHRPHSPYFAVRQARHRWDWATENADGEGLRLARAEALSKSRASAEPWVVDLVDAGRRAEWARFTAGKEKRN
jgi:hypothetical protein